MEDHTEDIFLNWEKGTWYHLITEEVLVMIGLIPLGKYIKKHQDRTMDYVVTHPILNMCLYSLHPQLLEDIWIWCQQRGGIRESAGGDKSGGEGVWDNNRRKGHQNIPNYIGSIKVYINHTVYSLLQLCCVLIFILLHAEANTSKVNRTRSNS